MPFGSCDPVVAIASSGSPCKDCRFQCLHMSSYDKLKKRISKFLFWLSRVYRSSNCATFRCRRLPRTLSSQTFGSLRTTCMLCMNTGGKAQILLKQLPHHQEVSSGFPDIMTTDGATNKLATIAIQEAGAPSPAAFASTALVATGRGGSAAAEAAAACGGLWGRFRLSWAGLKRVNVTRAGWPGNSLVS